MAEAAVTVCPWLGDRRWVYSITFDEALADLHRFTIPILERYGVPGHVEVVVGQLGQVRDLGGSSFDGFRHMNAAELRELVSRGWGVGNHSWSHKRVDVDTADVELGRAKRVLEDAIGAPVTVYCAPGSNANMNAGALDGCRRYGYLGAMSLTDALNRPGLPGQGRGLAGLATSAGVPTGVPAHGETDADGNDDLLWLNRTFLHTQGYGPFFSAFDPYRGVHYARRERGWIVDYLHCPLERAVHPNKDCSADELRDRIETVVSEGGADVWLATVEQPTDYRYMARHTRVARIADGPRAGTSGTCMVRALSAPGLPDAVQHRTVTLSLPAETTAVEVDGRPRRIYGTDGRRLCDVDPSSERELRVFLNATEANRYRYR